MTIAVPPTRHSEINSTARAGTQRESSEVSSRFCESPTSGLSSMSP